MAEVKLSELSNSAPSSGNELVEMVQNSLSKNVTINQIASFIGATGTVVPGNYHAPGKYVTQGINCGTPITYTAANGSLRAFPWIIPKAITVTQIQLCVNTFVSSTKMRVGIYTDNGSSYPNQLVAGSDTGEFNTDTPNGAKSSTGSTSILLNPGLYWVATNSNGAPVLTAYVQSASPAVIGVTSVTISVTDHNRWLIAQTYGPMPSTFPVGATSGSAGFPVIGFLV